MAHIGWRGGTYKIYGTVHYTSYCTVGIVSKAASVLTVLLYCIVGGSANAQYSVLYISRVGQFNVEKAVWPGAGPQATQRSLSLAQSKIGSWCQALTTCTEPLSYNRVQNHWRRQEVAQPSNIWAWPQNVCSQSQNESVILFAVVVRLA